MPSAIRAVSLDAGGTLMEVWEPVGETYARHGRSLGFAVDVAGMERGFLLAFRASPPLAAPSGSTPAARLDFERAWWREVVARALSHALDDRDAAQAAGPRFERLFDDLFAHYATAAAWRLFPDALPCLEALAGRGLRLGILSNFDGRLHALVDQLGLGAHVSAVVVSSEAGATKPSPIAFDAVRRELGSPKPEHCLHVGDSLEEDARGAAACGWRAVWLARDVRSDAGEDRGAPLARIATLSDLPELVDAFR